MLQYDETTFIDFPRLSTLYFKVQEDYLKRAYNNVTLHHACQIGFLTLKHKSYDTKALTIPGHWSKFTTFQ